MNEALLKELASGSRRAFDLFYYAYYDQVFRFAYFFLKAKEGCREVVTNVFFSVWQSRTKLGDIQNIETYLYIATRNEATRYQKRLFGRSAEPEDNMPLKPDLTTISPEDELELKEVDELLAKNINELPPRCRQIFLMAREEGLKTKEIAERLSISESTVRVQLKIAIEKVIEGVLPYYPHISFSILLAHLL
ncbi:MAG: RNA polymerase sigma-70 factor [Tannerellaceae bacterium]|jgi:RNA polymerase sigma-70 factor (ECF subfamily)|nr:RNA polymerase sigma-70 factor [Tannerellaceae bacterium]